MLYTLLQILQSSSKDDNLSTLSFFFLLTDREEGGNKQKHIFDGKYRELDLLKNTSNIITNNDIHSVYLLAGF